MSDGKPALPVLNLTVVYRPTNRIKPESRNARTHSKKQVAEIAASIRQFGFSNPLLIDAPPAPPDATVAAALREEAREQLDVARKVIAECGYHRRDEELAELYAVVAGGRRSADLPPRV